MTTSTAPLSALVPPRRFGDVLAAWIRQHPIGAFLAWFFTVGWAPSFVPVFFQTGLPNQAFIVTSTLVGLLLPAVAITRVVDGPEGLRGLWGRVFDVRASLGWYALALFAVPATVLALAVSVYGLPDASPAALLSALAGGLLLQTVVGFVTTNWWEEVAWMGLVQSRLQARHGALLAAVLVAPLFTLQHLSFLLDAGAGLLVLLPVVTLVVIPFRALLGWVYNRTGSLFLVGLLHAAGNAAATGSGLGAGFLPRLYAQPDANEFHLYAELILGLVVIAATRGRLGLSPRARFDREAPTAVERVTER